MKRNGAIYAAGGDAVADDDHQPPPAASVVAALLRLIAAGREAVELQPWAAGCNRLVTCASGWWVVLEAGPDGAVAGCQQARPPSMLLPSWRRGCQRDDWTLGPESTVIDPVGMLSGEQLDQLRRRLENAPAPPPEPEWWDPPWDEDEMFPGG